MVISQAGPVELIEAVDELGNSLVLAANDDQRAFGAMGMAIPAMPGGNMANLTVHLHRPDAPGKLIKKLRGTADVAVAALRPDPLVIPLAGAAGKTFENPNRRVVVNTIDTERGWNQLRVELTIDGSDDLFPAESAGGMGTGFRPGMIGGGGFNPADPQSPIQVVMSEGRNAFFQSSIDRDSGRVTLRVMHAPQMGEVKEIRIASVVRARTKVTFAFHDLPMP